MTDASPAQTAVMQYIAASNACFVQDVLRSRRLAHYDGLEESLRDLERRGQVLIRPHSAGDPHLEGTDLRIVALVRADDGDDALSRALSYIDKAWDAWLADFLANHRCS